MSSSKKAQPKGKISAHGGYSVFQPLCLTVIFSCIAIAPFTFDAFVIPKLFVLFAGLLTISLLLLTKQDKLHPLNPTPIWLLAILVSLAAWMIVATANSDMPVLRAMFGQFGRGNGLFYYFGMFAVLTIAMLAYSHRSEFAFAKSMTYLSIGLSIYALLQSIGIDFAKLDSKGLLPTVLTFGNSNFAGGMLAILFGYIFTRSFALNTIDYKDLGISLLLVVALYQTAAVQGYLIVLFVIFIVLPVKFVTISNSRNWRYFLYSSWTLGALLVALGAIGFGPLARIFDRPTFQMRIEYWTVGLRLLKDNILFGVGPDRLYDVTSLYMTPGSLQTISSQRLDSPHNWFISFGTSFGVPALILSVLLFGTISFVYLRKMQLSQFLSALNAPTFMAFLCVVIDAFVSIEQPGLGIWLYFLGGKVLGSVLATGTPKTIVSSGPILDKRLGVARFVLVSTILATSLSLYLISDRFVNDALLRRSIQSAVISEPAKVNLKEIELRTIKLKAEPEYVIQSVPILAKFADRQALLNISKSFYDYNPASIQSTGIRAQVLKVVTSLESSCPYQVQLISDTPWQQGTVENYLDCIALGFDDKELQKHLAKVKQYRSFSYPEVLDSDIDTSLNSLLARALDARLEFELGNRELARTLKDTVEKLLRSYEMNNPEVDLTKANMRLDF
jgi:hypothetical protein